jgi:outer membrane protein TolC
MQPSHSLLAVGIGAVIALCPIGTVASQTAPSVSPSPTRLSESNSPDSGSAESAPLPATPASEAPATPDAAIEPTTAEPTTAEPTTAEPTTTRTEATSTPSESTVAPTPTSPDTQDPFPEIQDPASDAPGSVAPSNTAPSNTAPSTTEDAAPPAMDTDAVPQPDPTTAPSGETDAGVNSLEYLDASPNPLQFPTRPEEVEIVGTQPITLQQALELAQRNSRELQVAQQELERSRAALRQARAALLPTLDTGASINAQETQQAEPGRINPTTGQFESGGTSSTLTTTLSGAIQLNYDVYTAGRRSATIRANEAQVRFQELQLELTAEQLRLDVTNDYYDLQEADEQVRIARAALEEAERSLRDAQALERAGVGTRFDVLQAEVDVANSRQELTQRISAQQIARRQVVRRIGLAESADVSSADPVAVADLWNLTLEESIVLAYRNRAELEQQLVQRQVSQQQRRAALADTGPQVSVFANYNVQNQLDSDQGFNDTYQFGARVDLRIFDAGASRAAADQEESNVAIAETRFADARNQIRFEVEQAYYNLQANFDNIQTASLAVEQATESLRLARLRFQAGVGTQTDVLRSQTELTRAELNRVQAILGYNRSLAQLQRSVSNFPDGNLAETP